MKKKIFRFVLPIGMGLTLTGITIMVVSSTIFLSSCEDLMQADHCKAGYTLYCSEVKQCRPAGYAYYCDGKCSASPCSVGTVTVDSCVPE
jgi:hypothetical protein